MSQPNQDPRPTIPTHEREVIDAEARKMNGRHDKVSTTTFSTSVWYGIAVNSRYSDAAELELMLDMVEAMTPAERSMVQRIYCDSKRGNDFAVELRTWNEQFAWAIAQKLGDVACEKSQGHSGVSIHDGEVFGGGKSIQIDGDVAGDYPD
ncbi:MAG: hypothetical protein ACOH2N_14905 [Devosia sp.]